MSEALLVSPEILMGEAGTCGFWAMVAIAYVYQRNPRMNGWQNETTLQARLSARLWPVLPDPSRGARYVFSVSDLKKEAVMGIVKETGPPKRVVECTAGGLFFY
jgi:hypothetical protein